MGKKFSTRHGFGTGVGEDFLNRSGGGGGLTRPEPASLLSLIILPLPAPGEVTSVEKLWDIKCLGLKILY